MISYRTRQAIAALPGKTVQPWKDTDERCHCTHCDLCGVLYRTTDIGVHELECQEALVKALITPEQLRTNAAANWDAGYLAHKRGEQQHTPFRDAPGNPGDGPPRTPPIHPGPPRTR